jgi:hypothetical protein
MSDGIRIVLVGRAKTAHDQMLAEIQADKRTSISPSKLINWIVTDYFERLFELRKGQLCHEHLNERKYVLEAMRIENPVERRRALQEAARVLNAASRPQRERRKKTSSPNDAQELK